MELEGDFTEHDFWVTCLKSTWNMFLLLSRHVLLSTYTAKHIYQETLQPQYLDPQFTDENRLIFLT